MFNVLRIAALLAICISSAAMAWAQPSAKLAKIGYLAVGSPTLQSQITRLQGMREGLKQLGYVEGKNFVLELRFAQGQSERLPELAAELLRQNVDVIVSGGPSVTRALKQATGSVPIVMVQDPDPVNAGFVASLARPGGNITGNASLETELIGKKIELLKILLPKMTRIAVLGNSNEPGNAQALQEAETAARVLGLQLVPLNVVNVAEIGALLEAAVKARADALLVLGIPNINTGRMVELAAQHRLPTSYWLADFVAIGGLMAYSPSLADQNRRVAVYIDKILNGRKPADLPVEQPTRFELAFNMKTAKAMGLTVPQGFLARVDRLIE